MTVKGLWENVTVVLASEFGRTLMGNSGNGRYVYSDMPRNCSFMSVPI